jgi:hypothetical protein
MILPSAKHGSGESQVEVMAQVVEIPLHHPARRPNPYHLRIPEAPMFRCPYGCGIGFNERWNLDLHLLDKHPTGAPQKTKIEWW